MTEPTAIDGATGGAAGPILSGGGRSRGLASAAAPAGLIRTCRQRHTPARSCSRQQLDGGHRQRLGIDVTGTSSSPVAVEDRDLRGFSYGTSAGRQIGGASAVAGRDRQRFNGVTVGSGGNVIKGNYINTNRRHGG